METLVERNGIPQSTIYYWLDRLEKQPLVDALRDEPRPGRPPKLSSGQRVEVEAWLDGSPRDVGSAVEEWTAEHLDDRILDTFDVEYSEAHIHRLFFKEVNAIVSNQKFIHRSR